MELIIARKVQQFYNKTPFPDYDLERFKTKDDLVLAAYPFAKYLNIVIPKDKSIIDVGCGTGQLAAYLSLNRKKIWGIDFSRGSLRKAGSLKKKLGLTSLTLQNADVLNLDINERFDYVICNGVLHHTKEPYKGFQNIAKLLKPGGFIMVGLYNSFGRKVLQTRRFLARTIFLNSRWIKDYFIKKQITSLDDKTRAYAWYQDQYEHPHESTHTVKEVLQWFQENNIEYINSMPTLRKFDPFSIDFENLFVKENNVDPSSYQLFAQLKWIWMLRNEGGYFLTIGRRT